MEAAIEREHREMYSKIALYENGALVSENELSIAAGEALQLSVALTDANDEIIDANDVEFVLQATKDKLIAVDQSISVKGICSLTIDGEIVEAPGEIVVRVYSVDDRVENEILLTVKVVPNQMKRRIPRVVFLDVDDIWDLFYR